MNTAIKVLLSGAIILIAVGVVLYKYWDYVTNPWTRDGQVRAQVIQINPRISGPIVKLPIVDNQQVKAGDLLFVIDPRTYQSDVDEAKAVLAQAMVEVDEARDLADRAVRIRKQNVAAISERDLTAKQNSLRNAQNASTKAQAQLDGANLNLEFAEVRAPVDGYVTHLKLRLGSQAVANQPALALVDVNSYWVDAYFRENYIAGISPGNRAIVTLMSYPDRPLEGRVDSHGWGISKEDGTTGNDLLPSISATFEWIRLAQRVPVVVHLLEVPDDVKLLVGTTASVLVMTGTHGDESKEPVPATPRALQ